MDNTTLFFEVVLEAMVRSREASMLEMCSTLITMKALESGGYNRYFNGGVHGYQSHHQYNFRGDHDDITHGHW